MDLAEITAQSKRDGFVVIPSLLPPHELAPALRELGSVFPTAQEFHDRVDAARCAGLSDEFGGIRNFPFASSELGVLAVHPRVIDVAEALLDTERIRVYSIEAWAKYTGAAKYDQSHHRDYLNHSILVPTNDATSQQVEMFLYLTNVTSGLGPPSFVPRRFTDQMTALPNWYPRDDHEVDPDQPTWIATTGRPDLYEAEVSAAGPAGTVVAYRVETFHRATEMTEPRGARFTLHVSFRRDEAAWISRRAWADSANTNWWHEFVERATARQLELFGFPPPGDPYWTRDTLNGMALRYPNLDLSPWRT